jgi:hypothetical protein
LQYEGSKTISSASQIPSEQAAFTFNIIHGSCSQVDLNSKKNKFVQGMPSAVPKIAAIKEFRGKF